MEFQELFQQLGLNGYLLLPVLYGRGGNSVHGGRGLNGRELPDDFDDVSNRVAGSISLFPADRLVCGGKGLHQFLDALAFLLALRKLRVGGPHQFLHMVGELVDVLPSRPFELLQELTGPFFAELEPSEQHFVDVCAVVAVSQSFGSCPCQSGL